jgi:hypothetical protein
MLGNTFVLGTLVNINNAVHLGEIYTIYYNNLGLGVHSAVIFAIHDLQIVHYHTSYSATSVGAAIVVVTIFFFIVSMPLIVVHLLKLIVAAAALVTVIVVLIQAGSSPLTTRARR